MFLLLSSLNESIVLDSVVSSAYIMKWTRLLDSGKSFIYIYILGREKDLRWSLGVLQWPLVEMQILFILLLRIAVYLRNSFLII